MAAAKNIIIIDDDQEDLELFELAFKETCLDIVLHKLTNAETFIPFIKNVENPQLVILDLNMPFYNGIDCLQWIRNKSHIPHVPVIVFSTSSNKKDIEDCLANGANQYIVKPNNFSSLMDITSQICQTFFKQAPAF